MKKMSPIFYQYPFLTKSKAKNKNTYSKKRKYLK